jgi:hypothetical protein
LKTKEGGILRKKKLHEYEVKIQALGDEIAELTTYISTLEAERIEQDLLTDRIAKLEDEKIKVVMVPEKVTKAINWDELRAYIVKLSQPTHFADSPDIEFDRIVLLCRREFEKEFHFTDLPLYLTEDEIDVVGQAGSGWFVKIADLPDGLPMMLVAYTERDVEEFMDVIIDANAIKSLKERVLERMHLNMLNSYRKYEEKINEAEFLAEKDRADKEKLLRRFKERLALLDNDTQEKIQDYQEEKLKKWQQLALGAGWVVAFFMAFFI